MAIEITIDLEKAKQETLKKYNFFAVQVAQTRQLNTMTGIENAVNDADWIAMLNANRAAINSAMSLDELLAIQMPAL